MVDQCCQCDTRRLNDGLTRGSFRIRETDRDGLSLEDSLFCTWRCLYKHVMETGCEKNDEEEDEGDQSDCAADREEPAEQEDQDSRGDHDEDDAARGSDADDLEESVEGQQELDDEQLVEEGAEAEVKQDPEDEDDGLSAAGLSSAGSSSAGSSATCASEASTADSVVLTLSTRQVPAAVALAMGKSCPGCDCLPHEPVIGLKSRLVPTSLDGDDSKHGTSSAADWPSDGLPTAHDMHALVVAALLCPHTVRTLVIPMTHPGLLRLRPPTEARLLERFAHLLFHVFTNAFPAGTPIAIHDAYNRYEHTVDEGGLWVPLATHVLPYTCAVWLNDDWFDNYVVPATADAVYEVYNASGL